MQPFDCLKQRILHNTRYTTICLDAVRFPRGIEGEYLYVHRQPSVAVVPLLGEGTQPQDLATVLVRQYRYPIRQAIWQFPMGFREEGVPASVQAIRELQEETGYVAEKAELIGEFYHDPGLNTQATKMFVARNPVDSGSQSLEPIEDIETMKVPLPSLRTMVQAGQLHDALTISILYLLEARLGLYA